MIFYKLPSLSCSLVYNSSVLRPCHSCHWCAGIGLGGPLPPTSSANHRLWFPVKKPTQQSSNWNWLKSYHFVNFVIKADHRYQDFLFLNFHRLVDSVVGPFKIENLKYLVGVSLLQCIVSWIFIKKTPSQ